MKKIFIIFLVLSFKTYANSTHDITKVVIPAAGLGTRFLPFTKAVPKEMLPLDNKPAIQHVVEEAINSGIKNVIIITNELKKAIENHFGDCQNAALKENSRYDVIVQNDKLFRSANFTYLNQTSPRGLGDAILMAQEVIGDEFFAVMLPDDIIASRDPGLEQLIEVALQEQVSVIAVEEVPFNMVSSYGIISVKQWINPSAYEIGDLVEKPRPSQAPSNLGITGRYVLSPKIFDSLKALQKNLVSGELQLTDAISHMMRTTGERVIAYKLKGTRYDTGTPLGWIKAVIDQGLNNATYKDSLREYLIERLETTHRSRLSY